MIFPLLGTRQDNYLVFQYLPVPSDSSEIHIALPTWASDRQKLNIGEAINLHAYFKTEQFFQVGEIASSYFDQNLKSDVLGIRPLSAVWGQEDVYINASSAEVVVQNPARVIQTLKDCWLLKKGIKVYLKHLVPYFSRISDFPQADYSNLKALVWNDVQNHVQSHVEKLETIYQTAANKYQNEQDLSFIPETVNLDELKNNILSEIAFEVFQVTFPTETPLMYLNSIKDLERRLYHHYNTIVLIYSTLV